MRFKTGAVLGVALTFMNVGQASSLPFGLLTTASPFALQAAEAKPQSLFARCQDYLSGAHLRDSSPTSHYDASDWGNAYKYAQINGNSTAGALAFSKLLLLKAKDLQLSRGTRLALRYYSEALEKPDPSEQYGYFNQVDSLGNKIDKLHRTMKAGKEITKNILFSYVPFGYRLVPYWLAKYFGSTKMITELRRKEIPEALGLKNDDFFQDMLDNHFFSPKQIRFSIKKANRGIFAYPAGIAVLSAFIGQQSGYGIHPLIEKMLPVYPDDQFLADIEKTTGHSFDGKKVALIYDRDFIYDSYKADRGYTRESIGDINADSIRAMQVLKARSSEFHAIPVDSVSSLDQALQDSEDADVVIVAAHGLPGDFVIGGQYISKHVGELRPKTLNENTLLIFYSCSFGDLLRFSGPDVQQETWVRLSRQVLGESGVAVAATNNVGFRATVPVPKVIPVESQSEQVKRFIGKIPRIVASRGFIGPEEELSKVGNALNHTYGTFFVGFREYDASTGQVRYRRH